MTELELWENTQGRYVCINSILLNLLAGINSSGNPELDIPLCLFCKENKGNCENCDFKKILNNRGCNSLGTTWWTLRETIFIAHSIVEGILEDINNKILELREGSEC